MMNAMTVRATVRDWHEAEGWGVVDSVETPGGCWTHFSVVDVVGYRRLVPGQPVDLDWESPGQDGYAYRALRVVPG
jgi:CspA family cold shock protein